MVHGLKETTQGLNGIDVLSYLVHLETKIEQIWKNIMMIIKSDNGQSQKLYF
jgi:hypothetical protein